MPIAFGPVAGHCGKKPGFILSIYSHQIILYLVRSPGDLPRVTALSAFPHSRNAPVPSSESLQHIHVFLLLCSQHLRQCSRCGLTSAKERGRITLLTMIPLAQLRILLTLFATGVHLAHIHPGACRVLSCQAASQSLSPQQTLLPLPAQLHRTLHSSFLSSRRFLPPVSPACPGFPGGSTAPKDTSPAYSQFSVCCGNTLPHHPDH